MFRTAGPIVFFFVFFVLTLGASAQTVSVSQPTIWATKPDVAAFEKIENDRLAAAQASIDTVVAVKGARTIENTLAPFDEAIRQVNSAGLHKRHRRILSAGAFHADSFEEHHAHARSLRQPTCPEHLRHSCYIAGI